MALVPEFFTLLGIEIFLAISMLSAILDDRLPQRFQYLFQVSGAIGLAELFVGLGLVIGPAPVYQTRFLMSIVYLGFALSSVVGTNAYLMLVRRSTTIAPAFTSAVTVPFVLVSALFISSFLGSKDVTFSPAAIVTLAVLVLVASMSSFGFVREFSRRFSTARAGVTLSPIVPLPSSGTGLKLASAKEPEWEEAPEKKEGE